MRPSILMLHGFSAHKDTWLSVVKVSALVSDTQLLSFQSFLGVSWFNAYINGLKLYFL